jgi:hypothetical protein
VYKEAFDAYFNRLPNTLQTQWFRDGDFIIGKVETEDGTSFVTQAKNADEFIEMVNDALFAVYEIPKEYFDSLMTVKKFLPKKEEFERLNNASIKGSSLGFIKKELKFA